MMLEGAFRLLDIDPMPSPHRFRAAKGDTINRLGIREPWDELDPADPTLRIAFLGDSITSGESVEPEQSFCHLVEGLVSPRCPGGVTTINMGDPGTSPSEQAERYEDLRWSIQPGVLVHVLHPDDLDGASTHRSLMEMHAIRDGDLWFGRFSYVLSYLERRVRYRAAMRDTLFSMRGGVSEEDRRESWAALKETVGQIKRMVESHQGRYVIVFHPWLFRLDDYPLVEEHRLMREFATQLGVPYLDLMEVYAGRDAESLRSGEGSELPNAAAHAMLANRIARFLTDDVLDETKYFPMVLSKEQLPEDRWIKAEIGRAHV